MSAFSVKDLDYSLPGHLIAQEPAPRREGSRLLLVDRASRSFRDSMFADLAPWLRPTDTLVVNDTRVVPAKLLLRRRTGGRVDGLFLRELSVGVWEVMLKGRGRLRSGEALSGGDCGHETRIELSEFLGGGRWRATVEPPRPAEESLHIIGRAPLPPYIHRQRPGDARDPTDETRYQTVYARKPGAVAAPTAGLHFTEELLAEMSSVGVVCVPVTLHVGLGTFAPIQALDVSAHRMHEEWYDLPPDAAATIRARRRAGGRTIAVGTTAVRTLETCASDDGSLTAAQGWTRLFCYPPYRFRAVDALLTNFHLPRSTLLALVMAFAGAELIRAAYRHAIEQQYRFYSYGDAMLIA